MAEAMTFFIVYQTARLNPTSRGNMLRMVGDPARVVEEGSHGSLLGDPSLAKEDTFSSKMLGAPYPSNGGWFAWLTARGPFPSKGGDIFNNLRISHRLLLD